MQNPLLKRKYIRKAVNYFNSERGIRNIPYGVGSRMISWFCKTDFAHQEFFKKKIPAFREFLMQIHDKQDKRKATSEYLQVNFLHGWRTSKLSHLNDRKYRKYVHFTGLDLFEEEYKKGKGVVLVNSHYGFPAFALSLFPRLGYKDFYTILAERGPDTIKYSGIRDDSKPNLLVAERASSGEMFSLLFQAKQKLEEGGILHVLGDGQHGRSSHSLKFMGKIRGFRASFAELGISSGASIIPVLVTPAGKSKVLVEFFAPLDKGSEEADHQERLDMIVEQYAMILESKWKEKPQYVNGGFVDVHIKQVAAR